ncbi:MAG TPA: carbon starvation CstA 5TM domain-containing protein, partial [Actinomycetospora sp.]|nr:carbon starvation CstA 5TM domain-containing protein [Actinomycetospora sp.]
LALGLSQILSQFLGGAALASFWYHFAIMFEALFILTAVDAGTRVARFMLQDAVGTFVPRFRDTSWRTGAWIGTVVMVGGWGGILIMGVTDPLGGINTLFPLFGIANQLLAAIALAVCLAIIARRGTVQYLWIVLVPLVAVAVITVTASLYKIFSPVPGVGYWAQHFAYRDAIAAGRTSMGAARNPAQMEAVVRNTFIQGSLSIIFLVLTLIVLAAATVAAVRSVRSGGSVGKEDEPVPSARYAPSGLIATPSEKELEKRWLVSAGAPTRGGGH